MADMEEIRRAIKTVNEGMAEANRRCEEMSDDELEDYRKELADITCWIAEVYAKMAKMNIKVQMRAEERKRKFWIELQLSRKEADELSKEAYDNGLTMEEMAERLLRKGIALANGQQ